MWTSLLPYKLWSGSTSDGEKDVITENHSTRTPRTQYTEYSRQTQQSDTRTDGVYIFSPSAVGLIASVYTHKHIFIYVNNNNNMNFILDTTGANDVYRDNTGRVIIDVKLCTVLPRKFVTRVMLLLYLYNNNIVIIIIFDLNTVAILYCVARKKIYNTQTLCAHIHTHTRDPVESRARRKSE